MRAADVLISIRKISRSVNLESKRIEKEYGISIPQLLTLSFLKEQPGFQAAHKDIKDFLNLNASTVTGIISRLEKKNLVARLPRANDRRVSMITLTESGSQLLQAAPSPLNPNISRRLQALSPEELIQLQRSFQFIIGILEIEEEPL